MIQAGQEAIITVSLQRLDSNKLLQHRSHCSGPAPEDTTQVLLGYCLITALTKEMSCELGVD